MTALATKIEDLLDDPADWYGLIPLRETNLPRSEVRQHLLATLALYGGFLGLPVSIAVAAMLAPRSRETAIAIMLAVELAFIVYAFYSERASPTPTWRENTWLDIDRRCWVRHRVHDAPELPPIHQEIAFAEAAIYCRTIHFETGLGFEAGLIRRCHLKRFQDIDAIGNFHSLLYEDDAEALETSARRLAAKFGIPCIREQDIFSDLLNRWKSDRTKSRLTRR